MYFLASAFGTTRRDAAEPGVMSDSGSLLVIATVALYIFLLLSIFMASKAYFESTIIWNLLLPKNVSIAFCHLRSFISDTSSDRNLIFKSFPHTSPIFLNSSVNISFARAASTGYVIISFFNSRITPATSSCC